LVNRKEAVHMFRKKMVLVICLFSVICVSRPLLAQEDAAQGVDNAAGAVQESLPAEEATGEGVVTGEVTGLDLSNNFITVKGEDGSEKSFSVLSGETILWKGVDDIKLSDIKKGEKAEVGYYTDDAGKLIASWVDVIVTEETASPAPSTGTDAGTAAQETPTSGASENQPAIPVN
jgi:hypothetical protein